MMYIKKLFICLIFYSGFSSILPKQSTAELAENLFIELTAIPSFVDQPWLVNLFKKISVECSKEQHKEIEVFDLLIEKCDKKLVYYDNLIKKKANNYKSILCNFSLSLVLGVFVYGVYKISQDSIQKNDQQKKAIENKLYNLGASGISAANGRASAWCDIWCGNQQEIRKGLRNLAYLSNYSSLHFMLTNLFLSLITVSFGICGIKDLLDQFHAPFYYEKLYFIKEALEQQRTLIKT